MRVIAIDGPAGSGKSTVARALAERLELDYLDTGAMYRAVTAAALRAGVDLGDAQAVTELATRCELVVDGSTVTIDGVDVTEEIRGPEVTGAVSTVAAMASVRHELVARQRHWVQRHGGGVLEGRDIGTVVFPDAALKVYLTASDDMRAARRVVEATVGTDQVTVRAELSRRDRVDSERASSPLAAAADAIIVDTTDMSVDNVVSTLTELWRERQPAPSSSDTAAHAAPTAKRRAERTTRIDSAWNTGQPSVAARALYGTVRAVFVGLCYLWFRVEVSGREHIPKEGGFILAPVHRSNLDTPIVASVTRRPLRFMGKDGLWKRSRAFGWFISALGGFPVSRGTVDREALRRCQQVLESGQPLVLYPEGTRQFGPVLQDTFDGPAFLALRTGVPIIPVGIGGSERAQPKGAKLIRPAKVRVLIGPPIHPQRVGTGRATSRRAVRQLTDDLRRQLQLLFDQARAGLPA